jgi:hypothetical protein
MATPVLLSWPENPKRGKAQSGDYSPFSLKMQGNESLSVTGLKRTATWKWTFL